MNTIETTQECSFCKKSKNEVFKLIQGPSVFICNECVQVCTEVLQASIDNEQTENNQSVSIPTPKEICTIFDQFVIGQENAKKTLSVAAYNHYKRVELLNQGKLHALNVKDDTEITKSNVLLIGPTGCGKTLLAQALAKVLNLPFAIVDVTTLTEAGYVGEDVENILQRLLQAANGDVEQAQKGIVYLDEMDKLSRRSDNPSITRDVSGEGVQQALLKLLEGTTASVPLQGSRKHPNQETVLIDTKNILFICGGTFSGLEKIIHERTERTSIGFAANIQSKTNPLSSTHKLKALETEDLVKYGLIPELIGRLPVITYLEELTEDQLVEVLTEPKNALIRQYIKLFKYNKVTLAFEKDALHAVAQNALRLKTGARGLRAILENSLLELMYDLPSRPEVTQVILNKESILKQAEPTLICEESPTHSQALTSNE